MLNHYQSQALIDTQAVQKAQHKKFVQMTDLFNALPIEPLHFIYIVSDIGYDGVGDLIHLIRAYRVLNNAFPGKIKCIAYIFENLQSIYANIAKDHQVQIDFRDIRTPATPENPVTENVPIDLIIHMSFMLGKPHVLSKNARIYYLLEIQKHSPEIDKRHNIGHMGFLYNTEGLWLDNIPHHKHKASLLLNSSDTLKMQLGTFHLRAQQSVNHWLSTTWISNAHYYEKNHFIYALIAQLQFIKKSSMNMNNVIIKHASKDRKGNSWELEKLLSEGWLHDELLKLNVNTIIINSHVIPLSAKNHLILRLIDTRFSHDDYYTFQQLINGISLPSGDNTYSESWSNKNTLFPPIPELRTYKKNSLAPLEDVIASLDIIEGKKNWLRDLIIFCQRMNEYANVNGTEWIIKEGLRLGDHLANYNSSHDIWVALSNALAPHDLNQRLVSIVKEQLAFAAHPDLIHIKDQLLLSTDSHAVHVYQKLVTRKLQGVAQRPAFY